MTLEQALAKLKAMSPHPDFVRVEIHKSIGMRHGYDYTFYLWDHSPNAERNSSSEILASSHIGFEQAFAEYEAKLMAEYAENDDNFVPDLQEVEGPEANG